MSWINLVSWLSELNTILGILRRCNNIRKRDKVRTIILRRSLKQDVIGCGEKLRWALDTFDVSLQSRLSDRPADVVIQRQLGIATLIKVTQIQGDVVAIHVCPRLPATC